jgi:hypothetical protein
MTTRKRSRAIFVGIGLMVAAGLLAAGTAIGVGAAGGTVFGIGVTGDTAQQGANLTTDSPCQAGAPVTADIQYNYDPSSSSFYVMQVQVSEINSDCTHGTLVLNDDSAWTASAPVTLGGAPGDPNYAVFDLSQVSPFIDPGAISKLRLLLT